MPSGPIDLGGQRVFVLGFDPEAAGLPPLGGPRDVLVVTPDGTLTRDLGLAPTTPVTTFDAATFGEGVAVVHTVTGARVLPTLSAIRAGVRTFHLVDGPGSAFPSNARGAVLIALRRAVARALARSPLGPWVERRLGRRLDPPWPSASATA